MNLISNLIPGQPLLAWLLVLIAATLVLYFIRGSAHQLLHAFFQTLYRSLRISALSIRGAGDAIATRNREVLFEHGRDMAERELERHFARLGKMVEKDLSRYPNIQRNIEQNIASMEDKLKDTSEVPPPIPEWAEAVESISKLKDTTKNDAVVGKLLQAIYEAFHKQQAEVMTDYRKDVSKRHTILKHAMPFWRRLNHKVEQVGRDWQRLVDQTKGIDRKVEQYEELVNGTPKAERLLKASTSTHFIVSLLVVAIAGFGAFVNYNLIALPMSELMPATAQVAGMDVSEIGAAVIIMLEVVVGLFFMEAIGITHLFPVISFMEDKKRITWAWICLGFLLSLSCVEAGLAYMREEMVADKALLTSFLVGGEAAAASDAATEQSNIPMYGQMTLGFVLPLILMFVAIPLESLIHTGRNVIGDLFAYLLKALSTVLRILGAACRPAGEVTKRIYDVLCFGPLWVEHLIESKPKKQESVFEDDEPEEENDKIEFEDVTQKRLESEGKKG